MLLRQLRNRPVVPDGGNRHLRLEVPVSGCGVFASSLSLLIRTHNRARCQAEMPPIAPSEIMEPLLSKIPLRSKTVEHPFGTIKAWMGATHFKMKTLRHVATEIALHVLAYNMTRVIAIFGVRGLVQAMKA